MPSTRNLTTHQLDGTYGKSAGPVEPLALCDRSCDRMIRYGNLNEQYYDLKI